MTGNSKWGNPYQNQITARYIGSISRKIKVPEKRFLGIRIRKEKFITEFYEPRSPEDIPDDRIARCEYKFRCGLIKAINSLSGKSSRMTLYLDGFPNVHLDTGNTEFVINPELDGDPVVDIIFTDRCTRFGEHQDGRSDSFATLIFRDLEQMREYIVATATTDPQAGPSHTGFSSPSNCASSSSGSSLWPLAAGFFLD